MPRYSAASYRYRPARYRVRWRRSSGRVSGRELAVMTGIAVFLAAGPGRAAVHAAAHPAVADAVAAPAANPAAAQAIAFAKHQLGCRYQWGGTGPCSAGFDCSGLIYAAYRSAGKTIPRTTFTEWKYLHHISRAQLEPGDLIEYAGSDGTAGSPGHVVMYLGGGMVIQAYATGWPVELTPLAAVQAGRLAGYVRP